MNQSKSFNVCLVQPSGYIHSLALLEASEYVYFKMKELGYQATFQKNRLSRSATNIVFGAHLCPEAFINLDEQMVIFNTEQLPEATSPWSSENYKALLKNKIIWDYSPTNINALSHPNISLVNFSYCASLERIPSPEHKTIDILFYGSVNERRQKILLALKSKGFHVETLFGVYGEERDKAIASATAVLNLNFYDSAIFPQIRTFYPLINRTPVISEDWAIGSAPAFHEAAVFSERGSDFVGYVEELLSSRTTFQEKTEEKILTFKSHTDHTLAESIERLDFGVDKFYSLGAVKDHGGLKNYTPTKMNLGSGKDYKFGYLNVDVNPSVRPDIIFDLSRGELDFPLLLELDEGDATIGADQFELIVANDVLEHVPDLTSLMTNCLKILRVGGIMSVKVPYDLSYGAWQDPTHIRAFNERSWLYYTDWFWYLGWTMHRFVVEKLEYQLSPVGQSLYQAGKSIQEILPIPRAVDSMSVDLKKVALSASEKIIASSRIGI